MSLERDLESRDMLRFADESALSDRLRRRLLATGDLERDFSTSRDSRVRERRERLRAVN